MLKQLDCYKIIQEDEVPKGCQIIPTKMDLKSKYDAYHKWIKDKARLVAN